MDFEPAFFTVTPVTPTIGAVISRLDLSADNPPEMFDELRQTLIHYKVIFLRDQEMSDGKFLERVHNFGNLEKHEFFPCPDGFPEIQVIATEGGKTGTDRWHTDVTFRPAPSFASILRACDIPPDGGGDTMWACTNAAYNDLSDPVRDLILKLEAVHDMRLGMTGYVDPDVVEESVRLNPPMTHPCVIAHPFSGKPHLFINSIWTSHIKNLSKEESDALLNLLKNHVKKPEFQVRFNWQPNSIAIWDNMATQHYAVSDYHYPRRMKRMTVDGIQPKAYLS